MKKRLPLLIIFIALLLIAYFRYTGDTSDNQEGQQETQKTQVGDPVEIPIDIHPDYQIGIFAEDLANPRDLELSPEGIILSTISSSGTVVALPDENKDGKADEIVTVLSELKNPHGLGFYDGHLFVAEEEQLVRYQWDSEALQATIDKKLFDLPLGIKLTGGGHWTRSIVFDDDGTMYVSIGSSCNVCEEEHPWNATIIVSDKDGNSPEVYATGLRNTVFFAQNPETKELWGADMGRDMLADELPREEINIIRQDYDYGWPYCYGDKQYDSNFGLNDPSYCDSTEPPVYTLDAHSAPLGITFIESSQMPAEWQGDILLALHGSWNRADARGYKVVRLNLEDSAIVGEEDFVSGFFQEKEYDPELGLMPFQSNGRPTDLLFDNEGSLYMSDDYKGLIYKIAKK